MKTDVIAGRIHVVAGVIVCPVTSKILISKRLDHLHQGGLWEFPGGKLHDGESPEHALARELEEELGIRVQSAEPFIAIEHDYPDKHIYLDVWRVPGFSGEATGREGQEIRWVSADYLRDYSFPRANQPIIERLLK